MNKLLTLLFLLISAFANAQKGTNTFMVSYGLGNGQIKPIAAKVELHAFSSEGTVRSFDIAASHMISNQAALEVGVTILNHRYQYRVIDKPGQIPVDKSITKLVTPVKLKVDVLKYFFISGGFLLNWNLSTNEQHGVDVGFGIGAGAQYYFRNKYGIFIFPQTNIHSLTYGLSEKHVAFGLAYRIN